MIKDFLSRLFLPATSNQVVSAETMENVTINQTINNFNPEQYPDFLALLQTSSPQYQQNNSIFSDLLRNNLNYIKELLNTRNIQDFEVELKRIIDVAQFNQLPHTIQSEYLYLLGVLYIEKNEIDLAKTILTKLQAFNDAINSNELMFKIICEEEDKENFELFISELESTHTLPEKILLYKAFFHLSINEFEFVIELLYPNSSIIESLKKDSTYFYYLGLAFYNLENFDLANDFLSQSQKLKFTSFKQLLLCINTLVPLLNSKQNSIENMYNQHTIIFNKCLKDLLDIKDSISKDSKEMQLNYYQYLLTIYLYKDPHQVLVIIDSLSDELKEESIFTFYLAEMHFILKEFELAYEKYNNLLKDKINFEIIERTFICMWELKKYEDIVNFFETYLMKDFSNQYFTAYEIYLRSLYKLNSLETYKTKVQEFIGTDLENWILYLIVGKLTENDAFIKKAIELIDPDNTEGVFLLALYLSRFNDTEKALEVMEKIKQHNEETFIFYLELALTVLNSKDENLGKYIYLALNPPVQIKENTRQKLLAELYFLDEDYILSTDLYEKIWDFNLDERTTRNAYNILAGKIFTIDSENIDIYLDKLRNTNEPHFLMICGLTYKDLKKDFNAALKFFYRAINLLKGQFDENIYRNYIGLFLPVSGTPVTNTLDFSNPIIEVDTDCIVVLENITSKKIIRIYIHSDVEDQPLKYDENDVFHYIVGSIEETLLRKRKIGQTLIFNNEVYKIINIENKFINLYQFCLKYFSEIDSPNKNFVTLDFDFENIEPTLETIKEMLPNPSHYQNLLVAYSDGKIPLIILSGLDYSKFPNLIEWLLLNPKYHLKAGPSTPLASNKIVLSLSSLAFLEINNLLNILIMSGHTIYIPKSIEIFIEQQFNRLLLPEGKTATMYLDEQSNLRFAEISEEEKTKEIDLWRNLLTFVKQCNIIKDFKREISNIPNMNLDIDSLNLAIDLNAIYITEDLILKKISPNLIGSNSAALIDDFFKNGAINISDYLELLNKLKDNNYKNLYSVLQLTQINTYLLSNERLYYRLSVNLLRYEKLLDEYLKNKKLLLWNLVVIMKLLKELQQNSDKENALPLIMTIYDSLIKASIQHFNNPYSLIAYLLKRIKS